MVSLPFLIGAVAVRPLTLAPRRRGSAGKAPSRSCGSGSRLGRHSPRPWWCRRPTGPPARTGRHRWCLRPLAVQRASGAPVKRTRRLLQAGDSHAHGGSGSFSCDRSMTGRGRETMQRGLRAERAGHDWSVVQRMLWRRRTIFDWCGSLRAAAPARNQGRYGQTIVRWSSVGAWSSPLSYSHSSRISCRSA